MEVGYNLLIDKELECRIVVVVVEMAVVVDSHCRQTVEVDSFD